MLTPPNSFSLNTNLVDLHNREIRPVHLEVSGGIVTAIHPIDQSQAHGHVLPGFVDAHVHIESSMLTPTHFGHWAAAHGTVATVSDPHEIANVLGLAGVRFMMADAAHSPIKTYFGAPSCVPATSFETAGAVLNADALRTLLAPEDGSEGLVYLAEMMNYPGVIYQDPEVMAKINLAHSLGKPVDGHAPGLRGEDLRKYLAAGISTDHECYTLDEALEKAELGMKILIREGSAAKNFDALHPIIGTHPALTMFCSDDKHPDDLLLGHINQLVVRAIGLGYDLFDVLRAACINPVDHYGLAVSQCRVGEPADMILVEDLTDFKVLKTWVQGQLVAQDGQPLDTAQLSNPSYSEADLPNVFALGTVTPTNFDCRSSKHVQNGQTMARVIVAYDGQLITAEEIDTLPVEDGQIMADVAQDILHIAVVNRYTPGRPISMAFIKGFGIKEGAIASTVAHDSHNVVVVGTSRHWLAEATNQLVWSKGGISVASRGGHKTLPLPIAGLMSPDPAEQVGAAYAELDQAAKELGSTLRAPFMTLSFMALLVIPALKLSDLGLFNGDAFAFVNTEVE
jgi:adenine deaminase